MSVRPSSKSHKEGDGHQEHAATNNRAQGTWESQERRHRGGSNHAQDGYCLASRRFALANQAIAVDGLRTLAGAVQCNFFSHAALDTTAPRNQQSKELQNSSAVLLLLTCTPWHSNSLKSAGRAAKHWPVHKCDERQILRRKFQSHQQATCFLNLKLGAQTVPSPGSSLNQPHQKKVPYGRRPAFTRCSRLAVTSQASNRRLPPEGRRNPSPRDQPTLMEASQYARLAAEPPDGAWLATAPSGSSPRVPPPAQQSTRQSQDNHKTTKRQSTRQFKT